MLVQRALDSVNGVDLNPFAVAIARFRLLVAALRASRIQHLRDAPAFAIHVAAGDSLLHGRRFGELDLGSADAQLADHEGFGHAFQAEDPAALNRILGRRYHVVVGNPPYITAKGPRGQPALSGALCDVPHEVRHERAVHGAILQSGTAGE